MAPSPWLRAIHTVEKAVQEAGATLSSEQRAESESAVAGLRQAMQGENTAAIIAAVQTTNELTQKLKSAKRSPGAAAGVAPPTDPDVVDAEFEEAGTAPRPKV